jgi:hypothetical protein
MSEIQDQYADIGARDAMQIIIEILEAMKFKDAPSAADVLCHGQSASTGIFMSVSF